MMADLLQFDLVSPEYKLASYKAKSVAIPSLAGDMTALAQHEPTIAGLRPGIVVVEDEHGATHEYVVSGGFAEVNETQTTILAERASDRKSASADFFAVSIQDIEAKLANLDASNTVEKMRLEALLADVKVAQDGL